MRRLLAGKEVCFEQLMLLLLDQVPFQMVLDRVVPMAHCDTVLQVAFGSGEDTLMDSAREVDSAYVDKLRTETGLLLRLEPGPGRRSLR